MWSATLRHRQPQPPETRPVLLKPLGWTLPDSAYRERLVLHTLGHLTTTPDEIQAEVPDPHDLPYSELVFVRSLLANIGEKHADIAATTVGIVGLIALAEESQKAVHHLTRSDQPKGWDYQLRNEPVFTFYRGRVFRNAAWEEGTLEKDIVSMLDIEAGTLQSSIGAGLYLRIGKQLKRTYATLALSPSRSANPISSIHTWQACAGIAHRSFANMLLVEGNTWKDSPSAYLDHHQTRVAAGSPSAGAVAV